MIVGNDFEDDILEQYRKGGLPQGLKIDCCLDDYWSHVPGQFTVVASHSGVGKTTFFVFYFFLLMRKHGLKFLIYSTENSIPYLKKHFIELYHDKDIQDLTDSEYYEAKAFVDHYAKFISSKVFYKKEKRLLTYKDLISISEKEDNDCLFIDPYTALPHEGNQYQWDTEAVQRMMVFCEETGKSIYMATHGKTEALTRVWRKGEDFEGHTKPLMPADVIGGGRFINNVHNQFFLHRYVQDEEYRTITECHINKFKENDRGGRPTSLKKPVFCKLVNGRKFVFIKTREDGSGITEDPLKGLVSTSQSMMPNSDFDSQTDIPF